MKSDETRGRVVLSAALRLQDSPCHTKAGGLCAVADSLRPRAGDRRSIGRVGAWVRLCGDLLGVADSRAACHATCLVSQTRGQPATQSRAAAGCQGLRPGETGHGRRGRSCDSPLSVDGRVGAWARGRERLFTRAGERARSCKAPRHTYNPPPPLSYKHTHHWAAAYACVASRVCARMHDCVC